MESQDNSLRVEVYFNRTKRIWSIRDKKTKRVIDHRYHLALVDVKFKVQKNARLKIISTKKRTVHAVVEGTLIEPVQKVGHVHICSINYDPFIADHFYCDECMGEAVSAAYVTFEYNKADNWKQINAYGAYCIFRRGQQES